VPVYEITIAGTAGPLAGSALVGFEVRPPDGGRSRLVGTVADEAALHAVLRRLHDLHAELLEVRRLDRSPEA
jgi:hypothetical protein